MSFGSVVVAIVAILAFAAMRIVKYNAQRDSTGPAGPAIPPARESELQREIADLRERVKVLERITTDANQLEVRQTRAIAAEIESLRDQ